MSETDPPTDRDAAELRAFLADRDVVCPGCGYNLRGLAGDRCPECSQPLTLRVGLTEPRLAMYLAALGALVGGASLASLFLFVVVLISIINRGWPRGSEAVVLIWVPAAMAIVEGALLAWTLQLRFRVRFRGLARGGRVRVVAGAWLLTGAFICLFLILLFRIVL